MNRQEFKLDFDNRMAKALMAETQTYDEVAAEFGVGRDYVMALIKRLGLKRRTAGKGSPAYRYKQQARKRQAV